MNLSPLATPFFACSPTSKLSYRSFFIDCAKNNFSSFNFSLSKSILSEWESSSTLSSCFCCCKNFVQVDIYSSFSSLRCLSFNMRGLKHRWNEVQLLTSTLKLDIIILVETGVLELSWLNKLFPDRSIFYWVDAKVSADFLKNVFKRCSATMDAWFSCI